ncbi:hypothetical protein PIB30_084640 [Stylosanthes scabra]|uniref:Uncharacterized protein n=1 Tax=Stylosanthes scabra TaxID=79078 RepID=A0ABU6USQ6_9FABA|nr:hypothetical protein [Stylosanthes scabra]
MQGNHRDKPTIEFDPEIEKTLKKNRSRVKAQRALQFEQEEADSEEGASEKSFEEELVEENTEEEIQNNMADNANNQRRTLADYTNPTTTSCGSMFEGLGGKDGLKRVLRACILENHEEKKQMASCPSNYSCEGNS